MPSKYRNIKEGGFDSKRERTRYSELVLMQRAGEIYQLQRQVKFILIPAQYRDGKCIERECSYYADFTYRKKNGTFVVEDCKGFRTDVYKIKRKLMLEKFDIRIKET